MRSATKRLRGCLRLIKGDALPLTGAQQELLGIFTEHLRQLPEYKSGDAAAGWQSDAYQIVLKLITWHFDRENPDWVSTKNEAGTMARWVQNLPDEGDHFTFLMHNAANAKDPMIARRSALMKLAQDKQRMMKMAQRYEESREELGLPRQILLAPPAATPIEIAAQAGYEANHQMEHA